MPIEIHFPITFTKYAQMLESINFGMIISRLKIVKLWLLEKINIKLCFDNLYKHVWHLNHNSSLSIMKILCWA